MCKRAIEPRYGKWTVPAGFLENGETVEEGALRETKEEAGIDVNILRLHSVYSLPHVNQVYLIFLSEMTSEKYLAGEETLECRFFSFEDIPWDEIAFTSIKHSLKSFIDVYGKNNRETQRGFLRK